MTPKTGGAQPIPESWYSAHTFLLDLQLQYTLQIKLLQLTKNEAKKIRT